MGYGERSRATDPRPARTRAAILAAIERLGELGEPLTVAAIVRRAGISRSTFYTQFRDLDDVAIRLMRDLYVRIEHLDAQLREQGLRREATERTTAMLIEEFTRHRVLYAAVFSSGMSADTQRVIQGVFAHGALSTAQHAHPDGVPSEFAALYIAGGMLAILVDWLLSDDPVDANTLQHEMLACLPGWVVG